VWQDAEDATNDDDGRRHEPKDQSSKTFVNGGHSDALPSALCYPAITVPALKCQLVDEATATDFMAQPWFGDNCEISTHLSWIRGGSSESLARDSIVARQDQISGTFASLCARFVDIFDDNGLYLASGHETPCIALARVNTGAH
jgi:hypothetical protein